MNNLVISLIEIFLEKVGIIAEVRSRGFRQNAGFVNVRINILGSSLLAVLKVIVAHHNVKRKNGDVVLFDKLGRKVAGAV